MDAIQHHAWKRPGLELKIIQLVTLRLSWKVYGSHLSAVWTFFNMSLKKLTSIPQSLNQVLHSLARGHMWLFEAFTKIWISFKRVLYPQQKGLVFIWPIFYKYVKVISNTRSSTCWVALAASFIQIPASQWDLLSNTPDNLWKTSRTSCLEEIWLLNLMAIRIRKIKQN